MNKGDSISRALTVVDTSLKQFFPQDFHSRCMYASLGLLALLEDEGIYAQMVGGDFVCAVIEKGGDRRGLHGFGRSSTEAPTHFWVQTKDMLLDLGPTYLPYRASFPLSKLPALRWKTEKPLPDYVEYKEHNRFESNVKLQDSVLQQRAIEFRTLCRKNAESLSVKATLGTWELMGHTSLLSAAQRGDRWAKAMLSFIKAGLRAQVLQ
jgi:hypothetical protein